VKLGQVIILLSTWSGSAVAGGWSDYDKAFPAFPCPDGWSTCEVDGTTVSPEMVVDSEGNTLPANMRFSFWNFESTAASSPFAGLSEYTGDMAGRGVKTDEPEVAEAVEEYGGAAAIPSLPRAESQDLSDPVPVPAMVEEEYYEEEPPSPPPAAAPVPVEPAPEEEYGGYKPPTLAEIEAAKAAAQPPPPEPVRAPVAEPDPEPAVAVADIPPPPPPVMEADCSDLRALETKAMLGQLGVPNRKCLDGRIERSLKLTDKDKISRVLISDAKARGDQADWERLMKRHLEKIDRSDPNMCLMYSIHLHKRGVGKSTQVIRWSGYALENKGKWAGAAHTRNVYYLNQLKSQAASRLWKRAEKRFVKDRNEKNEAKANKYRSMAKQYSRAWLDYAKASGKDTSKPLAACVSASGNTEFCPP